MTAWLRPWFVWLCIMGFGIMLHAQTAEPAPVQKALDILNTQGNTTYDFFDVYYFYSEQTISGNNLDCPTLSKNFDLVTKAYLVQFDTDGDGMYEWDIRVTSDNTRTVICRSPQQTTATAIPATAYATPISTVMPTAYATPILLSAPTLDATPILIQPNATATPVPTSAPIDPTPQPLVNDTAGCPNNLPPRLVIGDKARVSEGLRQNIRTAPTTQASIVFQAFPRDVFTVIDGYTCADGYTWWQLTDGQTVGWSAEGDAVDYWLEPPLAQLSVISPTSPSLVDVTEPNSTLLAMDVQFVSSSAFYVQQATRLDLWEFSNGYGRLPYRPFAVREEKLIVYESGSNRGIAINTTSGAVISQSSAGLLTTMPINEGRLPQYRVNVSEGHLVFVDANNNLVFVNFTDSFSSAITVALGVPIQDMVYTGNNRLYLNTTSAILIYDVDARSLVGMIPLLTPTNSLVVDPLGEWLALIDPNTNEIVVFTIATQAAIRLLPPIATISPLQALAVNPVNRSLAILAGTPGDANSFAISILDMTTNGASSIVMLGKDYGRATLRYNATGTLLAIASNTQPFGLMGVPQSE